MKAWEEHAADLYLLLNDILENQYAQRHGYKSGFYYVFNPHLPFRKTRSDYASQLMLLQQLADKKVLNFEVKNPSQDPPKSLICINAQLYVGQMIKLSIRPHEFAEAFTEFKKYGQRVTTKLKRASKSAKLDVVVGILTVDGFTIKFQTNTDMYDLLRMILEDRETRTQDWTYEEAKHYLSNSNLIDGNDFLRHTGNNINRRIKEVTGGSIPKFLESTTKSIRLNGEFV